MKKLLSLILTLAMLYTMCAVFGITAHAEGKLTDEQTDVKIGTITVEVN